MTNKQFAHYHPLYDNDVRAIARKFAKRDNDLFDDLYQIGLLALLDFRPESVRTNERACVRQAIRNRLIDYVRVERLASHTSLTAMLEAGDQLTADESGGAKLVLRTERNRHPIDASDAEEYATRVWEGA